MNKRKRREKEGGTEQWRRRGEPTGRRPKEAMHSGTPLLGTFHGDSTTIYTRITRTKRGNGTRS